MEVTRLNCIYVTVVWNRLCEYIGFWVHVVMEIVTAPTEVKVDQPDKIKSHNSRNAISKIGLRVNVDE